MTKYKITLYGLLGSIGFALICVLFYLIDFGGIIFLLFYLPGLAFGIIMAKALRQYTQHGLAILTLSTLIYFAMLIFSGKDFEYLAFRRIIMGGLGAVLVLMTVHFTTSIKMNLKYYGLGFIVGIITTFFMWTDQFESFNPWLIILSIVLWQTAIAGITDHAQLSKSQHQKN